MIGLFAGLAMQAQTTYTVNYLVVAGGGAGSMYLGAGGGGGGFLTGSISLSTSSYPITVGAGGIAPTYYGAVPTDGGNSSISNLIVAIGGGYGENGGGQGAGNGGSGGGGGAHGSDDGNGTPGEGNNGGLANTDSYISGGGGGAGGPGPNYTGLGGPGLPSSISGTLTYYAGGGGGSDGVSGHTYAGGIGGGGTGAYESGTAGINGTGGGGGGAGNTTSSSLGNGGSGIVILSFPTGSITYTESGGLITTNGSNTIVTFNSSGTFNITGGSGVGSTSSAGLWQQTVDSTNAPIYYRGKVGIGNNNPQVPLDVTGNARISGNLYIGGGLIESPRVSAITSLNTDSVNSLSGVINFADSVKMAKTLKVSNNIDAKSISFGGVPTFSFSAGTDAGKTNQLNLLANMSVQGNLTVNGTAGFDSLDAGSNLGFGGGAAKIEYIAPNSMNGRTINIGGGTAPILNFACAAPSNPGSSVPWNTIIQDKLTIWTPNTSHSSTPQQVLTIANDYSGASIDLAGTAANTANPSGILLMNYYCGKDVAICTNASNHNGSNSQGGVVSVGQNFEIGGPTRDFNTALNMKANGTNALMIQDANNNQIFNVDNTGNLNINGVLSSSMIKSTSSTGYSNVIVDANGKLGLGGAVYGTNSVAWNVGGNGSVGTSGTLGTNDNEDLIIVAGTGGTGNSGIERMRISFVDGATTITSTSNSLAQQNSPFKIINPNTTAFGGDTRLFEIKSNGSVYAREFYVQVTSFPDYVFDRKYKLLPISELENYLNLNKHLPNVPSAKEVEASGLPLGELQRISLEKTEELYLYVIELNKKFEEQNKKINKLEEQNKKLSMELNSLKK